jgi:hypothetical protein
MKKVVLLLLCFFTIVALGGWRGHLLRHIADEDLDPELMPFYLITFGIPENVVQPQAFTRLNPETGY